MKRTSTLLFAFGIVISIIWQPSSASADQKYTDEELRKFFEVVAVGKRPRSKVVKWIKAPTIRLETMTVGPRDPETGNAIPIPTQSDVSFYHFLIDFIAELNELTGLKMRLMPRDIGSGGDIVITVAPRVVMRSIPFKGVSRALLRDLLGPGRCFFVAWPDQEWRLIRAHIVINSLLDKNHIKHCFTEELTQAMGLPHDSDKLRPSIFNESSKEPKLTPIDHIVIRTLYDPGLPTGSGLGTVREITPKIIQRYSGTK